MTLSSALESKPTLPLGGRGAPVTVPSMRGTVGAPVARFAWRPVTGVAVLLAAGLVGTAGAYGYHRDELYFRVLGFFPRWGYVDQPPLTPLLARASIALLGDTLTALRVPAALCAAVTAVLLALLARELGGGRAAQVMAAIGTVSVFPLLAGHTLITSTVDMPFSAGALLLVVRPLLRDEPRAWVAAGVVTGVATYNKLLVVLPLLALMVGLLLVGPRRPLRSAPVWAAGAAALVVGLPNVAYQVAEGFPQLAMASALSANKGNEARATLLPLQLTLLGPLLAPVWLAGLVGLLRRPQWRPVRALPVAYLLVCGFLLLSGGQPYYTLGLLLVLWTAGCVVVEGWATRPTRWALVVGAVALNAAVSAVIALPVVPERQLRQTPIPAVNQVTRDSLGWPTYVAQVAEVYRQVPAADRPRTVVITSNYGEHGAVERYGKRFGLPAAYSGHNALWFLARPPDATSTVVLVNYRDADGWLADRFSSCRVRARLDNRIGVENEEQGQPVRVCGGPLRPWPQLWADFKHLS
jgi:4-amino-4-deoxy-L-arabinose transferase-like glycosyltransferase